MGKFFDINNKCPLFYGLLGLLLFPILSGNLLIKTISAAERPPIELPEVVIVGQDLSVFRTQMEKESPPDMPPGFKIQPKAIYEKVDIPSLPHERKTTPPSQGVSCLFSTPLTAGIASGFKPDEANFKLGLYNFQQKKYQEAIDQFNTLIEEHRKSPFLPPAYYWLGESYLATGSEDRGLESFLRLVKDFPTDNFWIYASYSAGWIYLTKGEYEEALTRLKPVRDLSEKDRVTLAEDARFLSGQALFRLNKYPEAAKEFAQLLNLYGLHTPYRPQSIFWQAESLYRIDEFLKAEDLYKEFIKDYPKNPLIKEARYGLAWSQLQTKKYQMALTNFLAWADEYSQDKFSESVALGTIKAMLGLENWTSALGEYTKLSLRAPSGPWTDQAALELGLYAFQKNDYLASARLMHDIIDNFPQSPNLPLVHFLLGEIYYHSREYQKALPHYYYLKQNSTIGYFSEAALLKEGLTLFRLREFSQAIEKLKEFIDKYSNSALLQEGTFWLAESLFQNKDYRRAAENYQKVTKDPKRSMEATYGLAWAFFKLEDWKKAVEIFSSFIQSYTNSPWRPDAMFQMAEAKANLGSYEEANSIFYQLATQYPNSDLASKSHYRIGLNYLKIGKFEESKKVFQLVMTKYPQSEIGQEAQYKLGEALFKEGKYPKARKQLEAFIQRSSKSKLIPSAWLKMGDSYYNEQNYDSALKYYQEIIKKFPSSPESIEGQYGVLLTLYQKGDFSAFFTGAGEFSEKYPQHPLSSTLVYQSAEHLLTRKDYSAALDTYNDLIRKNPKHELADDAQLRKGEIFFQMGKYPEAIRNYQLLLTDFPNSDLKAEAIYNIGKTYSHLKHYKQSLEYYRELITSYPKSHLIPAALFESGLSLWELQKREEAITYLTRLISTYPDSVFLNPAFLKLGQFYKDNKDYTKAIDYFKKALQAHDREIAAPAQLGFGQTLAAMGDLKQSVAELLKIVYLFPEKKELVNKALFEAGGYYEKLGKWDEAMAVYQKILDQNKDQEIQSLVHKKIQKINKNKLK